MKKTLLGTSALVSAGLVAGPAMANDPMSVTVAGAITTGFYVIDADDRAGADIGNTKVALVARNIDILAEGTLDNGMVVGAVVSLELGDDEGVAVSGNDATFQEIYGFLEGGFGRFEIGGTDGVAFKSHYSSPWFVPGNGVDSPNIYNATNALATGSTPAAKTSTYALMSEDANKVSYFTPRFAGFQLGASYSPNVALNDPNANGWGLPAVNITANPAPGVNLGLVDDVFDFSLNYAGSIGGFDLGVDGFYSFADSGVANTDPIEWGFGANAGYEGFTVGGAWYESRDLAPQVTAVQDLDFQVWTVGGAYTTGPYTVGVAYLKSDVTDASSPSAAFLGYSDLNKTSFLQFGGGYNLGAGVDIGVDVQLIKNFYGAGTGGTYIDTSGGVVLSFAF